MKVIGPYVVSAVSPGAGPTPGIQAPGVQASTPTHALPQPRTPQRRKTDAPALLQDSPVSASPVASSPVANPVPMHGLDRLTGMPVLLHRLAEFVVPLPLPASPHLLPVGEVDVWDAQPYAVTELPLAASVVTDPLLAARGALRGLAALHGAGLTHGGLNAAQLWQVGRDVRLAGAGLPWDQAATPESDVRALAQTLDALGVRPAALRDLERLSAAEALERLEAAPEAGAPTPEAAAVPAKPAVPAETLRPVRVQAGDFPAEVTPAGVEPAGLEVSAVTAAAATPEVPEHTVTAPGAPQVAVPEPAAAPPQPTATAAELGSVGPEPTQAELPDGPQPVSAAEHGVLVLRPGPEAPQAEAQAPYRSGDDIIVIGDLGRLEGQAETGEMLVQDGPAEVSASGSAASPTPSDPPAHLIPAPIRIGFEDVPGLPAGWENSEAEFAHGAPDSTNLTDSAEPDPEEAGQAARHRHDTEAALVTTDAAPEAQEQTPVSAERPAPPRTVIGGAQISSPVQASGTASRGQPLRIGWEEDHSWRVVKSGPARSSPAILRRAPRWLLPVVLAALLAGLSPWLLGRGPAPVACCSQAFSVTGSREPVKVTLLKAPPGSSLQPGAVLGTVSGSGPGPEVLKFQGVPGRYTLRFSAQGHGTLSGEVTVPSAQLFKIVLK